jgi:hypothetical protein
MIGPPPRFVSTALPRRLPRAKRSRIRRLPRAVAARAFRPAVAKPVMARGLGIARPVAYVAQQHL